MLHRLSPLQIIVEIIFVWHLIQLKAFYGLNHFRIE